MPHKSRHVEATLVAPDKNEKKHKIKIIHSTISQDCTITAKAEKRFLAVIGTKASSSPAKKAVILSPARSLKEPAEDILKIMKEAGKEAAAKEQADAVATAKAAPPPEKRAPIRFKDAVGRKFHFPWDMCCTWNGMEELIRQAFIHVENLAEHVHEGHYDLAGPSGEIILKECWEATIEPDWTIVMHLWPLPEPESPKPEEDLIPSLPDMVINFEDKNRKKGKKGVKIPAFVVDKKKRATAADVHCPVPVKPWKT